MLKDLGLATEEQIKTESERLNWIKSPEVRGCISTRICSNCHHLISDSICLCIGYFMCPNCKFENGKEILKLRKSIPLIGNPIQFQTLGIKLNS